MVDPLTVTTPSVWLVQSVGPPPPAPMTPWMVREAQAAMADMMRKDAGPDVVGRRWSGGQQLEDAGPATGPKLRSFTDRYLEYAMTGDFLWMPGELTP